MTTAHAIGERSLALYGHRFSPKKFTQHQLFACLVLKEFLRLDYRKLTALLRDTPCLSSAIGLHDVPHFTTFQKASRRLLKSPFAQRLLDASVDLAVKKKVMRRRVKLAAIAGTGFETHHISAYFVKRRKKHEKSKYLTTTYTRYPYAGIVGDCGSHMILAVIPTRGPGSDVKHFRPALQQTMRRARVETLLADAGYDGEPSHEFARDTCGMRTIIPPTKGRPTEKLPSGRWRRLMATRFDKQKYGQRWQVETIHSMLKRLLDSALRARQYGSQGREILLRVLTHNVMILRSDLFYRAG